MHGASSRRSVKAARERTKIMPENQFVQKLKTMDMGTRRKSTTSVTRESRSPAGGGSSKTASSMTKYSRSTAGARSSETASSVTREFKSSAGVRSSKATSDWSSLRDQTPRDWSSMMERVTRAGVRLTRVEERCSR